MENQPVYVANAIYRLGKSHNWSGLLALEYATFSAKNGKVISAQDLQKVKNEAEKIYRSAVAPEERRFDSDFVQLRYELYKGVEKLGFFSSEYLGDYFSRRLEEVYEDSMLNVGSERNKQVGSHLKHGLENAASILTDAYDLASANPEFKDAVDNVFVSDFQSHLSDGEQEIRIANPDFDEFLSTNGMLDATGKIQRDVAALKDLLVKKLDKAFASLAATSGAIGDQVGDIGSLLTDTDDKVGQILFKIAEEQRVKNEQALSNWEDYSMQSTISLLASLMDNKKFASDVVAVSNAIFQIKDLTAQFNSIEGMSAMGAVGLASGYIGIAVALFSAFSQQGGPSADEIIIGALNKVALQIEEVRKQVMEGLGIIDKKLDSYFKETFDNLNIIIEYLREIDVDVDLARDSLRNIALELSLLQKDVDFKLDYLINQELSRLRSKIRNFKLIHGREQTVEEIKSCLLEIIQEFEDAKEPIHTGDRNAIADVDSLAAAIDQKAVQGVISILKAYISSFTDLKLNEGRASRERLNICIDLIAQLALDNPVNFKEINSAGLEDIHIELKKHNSEVARFRGNEKNAYTKVFEQLAQQYLSAVSALRDQTETIYRQELERYTEIQNKDFSLAGIVTVLQNYMNIARNGYHQDNDSASDIFNGSALRILEGFAFRHQGTDSIRDYYPSIDFSFPLGVSIHDFVKAWLLCGNADCPSVHLSEELAEHILEENPFLVFVLNLGLKTYELQPSCFSAFSAIDIVRVGPAEQIWGCYSVSFALAANLKGDKLDISKVLIEDKLKRFIVYSGDAATRFFIIKDELKDVGGYKISAKIDGTGFYYAKDNAKEKTLQHAASTLKDYTGVIRNRVLADLYDKGSELYRCVKRVECFKNLIKLFVKYSLNENYALMSDNLAYLIGEVRTDFSVVDYTRLGKILPLLDGDIVENLVGSFSFPDQAQAKTAEFWEDNDITLQFLDKGFMRKANESIEVLFDEIYKLTKIPTDELRVSESQTLLEVILVQKSDL
ncbi:hypothetical protein [Pedobacter miscanthi]|uniref:hypothetical protein n=1 Tax=Pedobacter miscanthi TaxID=2259170 RepID=UPI00292E816C|nr:hypothetical protein [Pedobacter miscanthi]